MTVGFLPDAGWRHAIGLTRVVESLQDQNGGPRIVGGAVRDTLLGLAVSDVDLATMLLPDAVIDRLEAAHIKAVPTGLDHGTVTAVAGGKNYEITTLRRDVATDGRRATVEFATDWQEDAARRDFTFNALYADPKSSKIFDYFGGLADLESGVVRFIGDADQRIAEDFLRVMRYFRFLARYGAGTVDETALRACAKGAHGLTALSRERIAQELTKLLTLPDPVRAVALMAENGIFAAFLPELSGTAAKDLAKLVEREKHYLRRPSLMARLLALLPKDANTADRVAARLKLSNKVREGLSARISAPQPTAAGIRGIAYRNGHDCAYDVAMLYAFDHDIASCMAQLDNWDIPSFPLKGGDLIAMGLNAGPVVAATLKAVEAIWISEGFPGSDRLTRIADQSVTDALSALRKAKAASAVNGRAK